MNRLDIIIDVLEIAANEVESAYVASHIDEALSAARELKALEPVAWMLPEYGDVISASETDGEGIYNIPLYAIDEVNHVGME